MNDPLIPNRFSNLKFSLLNITALVVDFLVQENDVTQTDILKHIKRFSKDYTSDDVVKAITFLYAVNRISYSEASDTIQLKQYEITQSATNA